MEAKQSAEMNQTDAEGERGMELKAEAEAEAKGEAFKLVQDQFLPVLEKVMKTVESFLRSEDDIKTFEGDVDKFVRKWLGEFIYLNDRKKGAKKRQGTRTDLGINFEPADREGLITLKQNNCLTNDPCYYCGARCDPTGFDCFAEGTSYLVCDQCARKYSPNIFEIRVAALKYAKWEVDQTIGYLKEKIRDAIKEPIENRILKALDEIGNDRLDPDIPF